MSRLTVLCTAAALLALGACASEPETAPNVAAKRSVTPPGGFWQVTKAEAAGPGAVGQSPFLGQKLALSAMKAGDVMGRQCNNPVYQGWEGAVEEITGGMQSAEMRPIMGVICNGAEFGSYAGMADGSLTTRANDWILTLHRAEPESAAHASAPVEAPHGAVKAAPMHAAPAQPEAAAHMEPTKAESPPKIEPSQQSVVYLASYRTMASAKKGWSVLSKKSKILAGQKPILKDFDLGAKGKFIRLYGLAADEAERDMICAQLGKMVDECGSKSRE